MIRNKIFIRSKTINKRNKQAIDLTLWLKYYKVESFLETYEVVDGIRTYVDIPGYSKEKLTHAYAYEGIDLLKEVFKENFDLDIDKYIAVNFGSFRRKRIFNRSWNSKIKWISSTCF